MRYFYNKFLNYFFVKLNPIQLIKINEIYVDNNNIVYIYNSILYNSILLSDLKENNLYLYDFNSSMNNYYDNFFKIRQYELFKFKKIKFEKVPYFYEISNEYKKIIKSYKNFYKKYFNNEFFISYFSKTSMYKPKFIFINSGFFKINYLPTDNISLLSNNFLNFFIRKNKIFNKGRYSRNRQLYRTGVYWCIILNVIAVFGLYYYFYRFTFNFGYLSIYFYIFIVSLFGSRLVKYRFYDYKNIFKEIEWYVNVCISYMYDKLLFVYVNLLKYLNIFKNILIL